ESFRVLGVFAYFLGIAGLGALSIGHEYSHRTLGMLLAQPARRQHILLVKLGVLAGMLLTVSAVAGAFIFALGIPLREFGSPPTKLALLLMPLLCGLFLAPW